MLAWRDLDDPEAGGSEVHASTVARLWAEAGLEVTMRTSFASGQPQMSWRDGYRVIRKAGRYMVFPRAAFWEMMGWHGGRAWWRSGTACRSGRRSGRAPRTSRGCTTCTPTCGT